MSSIIKDGKIISADVQTLGLIDLSPVQPQNTLLNNLSNDAVYSAVKNSASNTNTAIKASSDVTVKAIDQSVTDNITATGKLVDTPTFLIANPNSTVYVDVLNYSGSGVLHHANFYNNSGTQNIRITIDGVKVCELAADILMTGHYLTYELPQNVTVIGEFLTLADANTNTLSMQPSQIFIPFKSSLRIEAKCSVSSMRCNVIYSRYV